MNFYHRLNYTIGNEDWDVEAQALRVSSGDHVVCVTASGDRPLHLLMTDCASVVSLDMNKAQNYLLDLKLAALAGLDYAQYLAFLGVQSTQHRLELYEQIKPHMQVDAIQFWDSNQKKIANGIIYQGEMETMTALGSLIFRVFRHKKVKQLLSFDSVDEQKRFIDGQWDSRIWRMIFNVMLHPALSRLVMNDPGLSGYTEYAGSPGRYIYERMLRFLRHHPAKRSALIQLILTGKVTPDAYFPYLREEGYHKIRRDMSRLTYKHENIVEYLNRQDVNRFDCFSMSDIASYMPQTIFERLLYGIQNSANNGARFCVREFMSKRFIPVDLLPTFKRNHQLEQKLELEEGNFVYRFMAGEVVC